MLITSINNNHIKDIIKLKEKKYRDLTDTYLVEGEHLVIEAFKNGLINELILEKDQLFPIPVNTLYVTKDILKKMSNLDTPSNVMAVVNKRSEDKVGEKVIILDGIQDPGNLGTIIRSAVAFGIDTIILSRDSVDLYNPKVIRSTMGMIFHINIITCDILDMVYKLKDASYKIIGTKVTNGKDVRESKTYSHFALVMGNEGSGVSNKILDLCDEYLYIRMNEECESLNVGVAASILMYEIYNK